MFSFVQNNQKFIIGKHANMVENCILEKTWYCIFEEIFDFSSFEDIIEISNYFDGKIHNMLFSKELVDEELTKNSSLHWNQCISRSA